MLKFIILIGIILLTLEIITLKTFNINNSLEQQPIKIGVFQFPGLKINSIKNKTNIELIFIDNNVKNPRELFPHHSNFEIIFDFGVRNKPSDYNFESYKEDISLSLPFYEQYQNTYLDELDFIFIPPFGMKFNDEFVDSLVEIVEDLETKFEQYCFLKTHLTQKDKQKIQSKYNFSEIKVNYPETMFEMSGGILIKPQNFRRLEFHSRTLYHIDGLDGNLQVFCDIIDLPIIIYNNNSKYYEQKIF